MDIIKAWKCPKGHVMGMIRKNSSGVTELLLYREALGPSVDPSPNSASLEKEVEVMAVVQGYVADVKCSACGAIRTWMPDEELARRMVRKWLERRRKHEDRLSVHKV